MSRRENRAGPDAEWKPVGAFGPGVQVLLSPLTDGKTVLAHGADLKSEDSSGSGVRFLSYPLLECWKA